MFYVKDIPKYEAIQARAQRYPQVDAEAVEAFLHMLRVSSDLMQACEKYLTEKGISGGRFSVLMLLNREPEKGLTPSDLADMAGVTRATMTGLLDGLEKDGMVERRNCRDDRRMCYIHLTMKAREQLDAMLPDYYTRVAGLMGGMPVDEKKHFLELLQKVNAGIPAISSL